MLNAQLSQLSENLNNLLSTLAEEKRCLAEKDFSQFNDVLFNKQKLLQTISSLDKQLTSEQNFAIINQDEILLGIKKTIETQLKDCKTLNDTNGKLVNLSMRSNKHLMQIMTQATGRNSVTYDQKGILQSGQLLGQDIEA